MLRKHLPYAGIAIVCAGALFLSACTSPVKHAPQLSSPKNAVGNNWPPYYTESPTDAGQGAQNNRAENRA